MNKLFFIIMLAQCAQLLYCDHHSYDQRTSWCNEKLEQQQKQQEEQQKRIEDLLKRIAESQEKLTNTIHDVMSTYQEQMQQEYDQKILSIKAQRDRPIYEKILTIAYGWMINVYIPMMIQHLTGRFVVKTTDLGLDWMDKITGDMPDQYVTSGIGFRLGEWLNKSPEEREKIRIKRTIFNQYQKAKEKFDELDQREKNLAAYYLATEYRVRKERIKRDERDRERIFNAFQTENRATPATEVARTE